MSSLAPSPVKVDRDAVAHEPRAGRELEGAVDRVFAERRQPVWRGGFAVPSGEHFTCVTWAPSPSATSAQRLAWPARRPAAPRGLSMMVARASRPTSMTLRVVTAAGLPAGAGKDQHAPACRARRPRRCAARRRRVMKAVLSAMHGSLAGAGLRREQSRQLVVARLGERSPQRLDLALRVLLRAALDGRCKRRRRTRCAGVERQPVRPSAVSICAADSRRRLADGGRQRLLQPLAQVGVLPLLDAPMRQAERRERADRRLARLADRAAARQLRGHRLEALGERLLGLGSCYSHVHLAPPARLVA